MLRAVSGDSRAFANGPYPVGKREASLVTVPIPVADIPSTAIADGLIHIARAGN
jgi:hypothetical protein